MTSAGSDDNRIHPSVKQVSICEKLQERMIYHEKETKSQAI